MDPRTRLSQQTAAQQEQLNNLVRSPPKEVRRQQQRQIDALSSGMQKSARTIREITPQGSQARSVAGSVARSRVSTAASSQQLRANPNGRPASQRSSQAYQPPSRRSSQASQVSQPPRPVRTPPGSEIRPSRTAPGAEMASQTQGNMAPSGASGARSTDNLQMQVTVRPRSQISGSQSARSLASVPMGSAGAYPRPSSARGSAQESSIVSSSDFSGCSTPVAGCTWGHMTRSFGNGVGAKQFPNMKHCLKLGEFLNDTPGKGHGDYEFNEGLERCVGHGKRTFLGDACCGTHLHGVVPNGCNEDIPGSFGHPPGDDFKDGLPVCIGFGIKKYPRDTHGRHHISDDCESEPGLHGHHKAQDYKDGIMYYIGHGKKRVAPGHKEDTYMPNASPKMYSPQNGGDMYGRDTPKVGVPSPDTSKFAEKATKGRSAGMSTKDIMMHEFAADPSRQGTHQDRRFDRRKDTRSKPQNAELSCPFAYRML